VDELLILDPTSVLGTR